MDPNKCLEKIREIIARLDETDPADYSACAIAEHFEALDEWLTTMKGFYPKDWQR